MMFHFVYGWVFSGWLWMVSGWWLVIVDVWRFWFVTSTSWYSANHSANLERHWINWANVLHQCSCGLASHSFWYPDSIASRCSENRVSTWNYHAQFPIKCIHHYLPGMPSPRVPGIIINRSTSETSTGETAKSMFFAPGPKGNLKSCEDFL